MKQPTNDQAVDAVEVTRADLDAAQIYADYYSESEAYSFDVHHEIARAFARHRIASVAAARPLLFAEAWQPIETAPRDGEVLLYCEETGEQFVAFWGTDPTDGDTQWVFARSPDVSFIVRDPTHWQPLPAPPSAAAKTDGCEA